MKPVRPVLALLLIAGIAGCSTEADTKVPQTAAPQPVVTEAPAMLPKVEQVRAIGRLEARHELSLSFKTGGVVAEVLVDIGDAVKAGQVLARLESAEIDAEVRRAQEALDKAERDLARAEQVYAQRLVALEVLDNARTNRDMAQASLTAARFNQTHATIVAPADGRVLARPVQGREIVAAGQPVLAVSVEGQGWLLRVSVSDREAVRLSLGLPAQIRFDAWPGQTFPAEVERIAGMADARTGTFDVELALSSPQLPLRSGLIGRAEMEVAADHAGVAVPVAALVDANREQGKLFVVADGKASLRSVRLGRLLGNQIAVLEGLQPQDAVIVSGAPYVNDGSPVRLVGR